jgi:hypothetical protein
MRSNLVRSIALAALIVVALAFAWYVSRDIRGAAQVASVGTIIEAHAPSGARTNADVISQSSEPPPTNSVEYHNEKYGFSYWHTPQATITEYDEGGGAMTVVHENFEKVRGMQIFIVPYTESLITEERFKADVPSGVRSNVEDTTLDGVRAVTFNSIDEDLGETREIWIIHNGFLFEITTMKGVGNWFAPIIQSWRFQ